MPYTKNKDGFGPAWSNSLFENNAEFSLGMCLSVKQHRDKLALVMTELLELVDDSKLKNPLNEWINNFADKDNTRDLSDNVIKALEAIELDGKADELKSFILDNKENLTKKSMWMYGGDGWAYDIGYGGLDHVLASGEDVNIMVVDTEVYSNTGGQSSKATPVGAVAHFASSGKKSKKKDLGMQAVAYGHVYVAQVAMGADKNQFMKALKEAESYNGPSVIIAYAPCINHGIVKGMAYSQQESKLAVESGYWNLYRFNPLNKEKGLNPFVLDSKKPERELREFLMGEVRYSSLLRTFPEEAEKLFEEADKNAKEVYAKYRKLAEN